MSTPEHVLLETIRESWLRGSLEIIVGAGASMASGLPGWNALNYNLLSLFFHEALSALDPEHEELCALSTVFAERFGREAVVDLVRQNLGEGEAFCGLLERALYEGRRRLELAPIQLELAAAVGIHGKPGPAGLYTFNYDDLLQDALEALHGVRPATVTRGIPPHEAHVVHLHGFLPPGATTAQGTIILSEKDYLRGVNSWADRKLEDLFDSQKDVLLVGLSLGDPRLRRLLFRRLERKGQPRSNPDGYGRVFALLGQSRCGDGADLATRRAHKIVNRFELPYWGAWDVHVGLVERHDLVPFHLRQIRLGRDPLAWLELGRTFLRERSRFFEDLYEPEVQLQATHYLKHQHRTLRSRYAVPPGEEVQVGIMAPSAAEPGSVQLAFHFGDGPPAVGGDGLDSDTTFQPLTEQAAAPSRLDLAALRRLAGPISRALVTGTVVCATSDSPVPEPGQPFGHALGRTLLCVPIYDSAQWVPLGVAVLASNRATPFWAGLKHPEAAGLHRSLRAMFAALLGVERHGAR